MGQPGQAVCYPLSGKIVYASCLLPPAPCSLLLTDFGNVRGIVQGFLSPVNGLLKRLAVLGCHGVRRNAAAHLLQGGQQVVESLLDVGAQIVRRLSLVNDGIVHLEFAHGKDVAVGPLPDGLHDLEAEETRCSVGEDDGRDVALADVGRESLRDFRYGKEVPHGG